MRKWAVGAAALILLVATPAFATPGTGALDTTFNSSGEVAIGSAWTTSLLAPAPNNGLYLALQATTGAGNHPVHLTRLTSAGTADLTFGSRGHTDVYLGNGGDNAPVALVSDGSGLLVALTDLEKHSFGVVRLTASGSLDRTFSGDGRVVFTSGAGPSTEVIAAAHVLPDGRTDLVLTRDTSSATRGGSTHEGGFDLVRLRADGSPDPTLAPYGIKNLVNWSSLGSGEPPQAAFSSDGKVYLALPYGAGRTILERRTTTGAFDPGFNNSGVRPYGCPDWQHIATGPVLRVDVLGRPVLFCTLTAVLNPVQNDVFVARLTTTGAADNTFGSAGHFRAWLHANDQQFNNLVYGIDATDRVVFAYKQISPGTHTQLHLARFTSAGVADTTFGTTGASTVTFGPQYNINQGPAFGLQRIYLSLYGSGKASEIAIAVTA